MYVCMYACMYVGGGREGSREVHACVRAHVHVCVLMSAFEFVKSLQ